MSASICFNSIFGVCVLHLFRYVMCLQEGGKMTSVRDGLFKYLNDLPAESKHTPDTLQESEFTLIYSMKLLEISLFFFGRRRLVPYLSHIQGQALGAARVIIRVTRALRVMKVTCSYPKSVSEGD